MRQRFTITEDEYQSSLREVFISGVIVGLFLALLLVGCCFWLGWLEIPS